MTLPNDETKKKKKIMTRDISADVPTSIRSRKAPDGAFQVTTPSPVAVAVAVPVHVASDIPVIKKRNNTKPTKSATREADNNKAKEKPSLLEAVSALMGPGTGGKQKQKNRAKDSSNNENPTSRRPSRPLNNSMVTADPSIPVGKGPKKVPTPTPPPPPPPPADSPPPANTTRRVIRISTGPDADAEAVAFLQKLEAANERRKSKEQDHVKPGDNSSKPSRIIHAVTVPPADTGTHTPLLATTTMERKATAVGACKKKKKPTLSAARQQDVRNELAKRQARIRHAVKESRREECHLVMDDDEHMPGVGWFSMTLKETNDNNNSNSNNSAEDDAGDNVNENGAAKKRDKASRQLRTTVAYSRHYNFATKRAMAEESGYYLEMIEIKRKRYRIHNLFTARPLISDRVYKFDSNDFATILDKKDDKWWIKSRLPLYTRHDEDDGTSDDDDNEDNKGMEALAIFFGPNDIDNDPDAIDKDDASGIFSIVSVESVHFSDDDENETELMYNGKPRETVEVMPGEFTILRKEEETMDAIRTGTYIESLCLGCGKALLSVQDAVQVACPSCGSITPLNAICLHKPFGIATGIEAKKVKGTLAPRKNVFQTALAGKDDEADTDKKATAHKRKVVTAANTRWIKDPQSSSSEMKQGAAATTTQRNLAPKTTPPPVPQHRYQGKVAPVEAVSRRRPKDTLPKAEPASCSPRVARATSQAKAPNRKVKPIQTAKRTVCQ